MSKIDAGFTTSVTYENSDTIEVEKVIRTMPEKGKQAEKGTEVVIVLSKGKATVYVKVPALTGMTKKQASSALKGVNLKLGNVSEAYSDTVPAGQVISQSVKKNTEVEENTTVDVTISKGPEVTYKYVGSITISDNPFADETQSGVVKFVLSQDGKTKGLNGEGEYMEYYDFPVPISEEGWSESEGEIIMYVNGARFNAYNIGFSKVAQ